MYVAELKRRRYRGKRPVEVSSAPAAHAVFRSFVGDWSREHFLAILLDARNGALGVETISVGSLSSSIVHPREVFKPAIVASASGIIVGHNHPSGDPEPSPEDLSITRRLRQVGELVGIEVLDHIVFTTPTTGWTCEPVALGAGRTRLDCTTPALHNATTEPYGASIGGALFLDLDPATPVPGSVDIFVTFENADQPAPPDCYVDPLPKG